MAKRYKPPSPGTLPKKGADMLAAVYTSARERGFDKPRSAQQAWCAVKRHYYKKGKKWAKRRDPLGPDEYPPGCEPVGRAANTNVRRLKNSLLR